MAKPQQHLVALFCVLRAVAVNTRLQYSFISLTQMTLLWISAVADPQKRYVKYGNAGKALTACLPHKRLV